LLEDRGRLPGDERDPPLTSASGVHPRRRARRRAPAPAGVRRLVRALRGPRSGRPLPRRRGRPRGSPPPLRRRAPGRGADLAVDRRSAADAPRVLAALVLAPAAGRLLRRALVRPEGAGG